VDIPACPSPRGLTIFQEQLAEIFPMSFDIREFNFEVQQIVVCPFAPEGRDVYSQAVLSFLRSSVGAQSLLPAPVKVPLPGFAPPERKRIQPLHLKLESTNVK
jgi:hypothetical protein